MENLLPTIKDYTHFLECAKVKFNIDINTARNNFGKCNYQQWGYILNFQGFEFKGVFIQNPFLDESGRFEVDPKKYYLWKIK